MTQQPTVRSLDPQIHQSAELRVPASSAFVSVLRMTTAGLAARLDFTLDDIEDLRMAVGEACALALEGADPTGEMVTTYAIGPDSMRVEITTPAPMSTAPDRENFGWQVLTAITSNVVIESRGPQRLVGFTVRSSLAV